MALNRKLHRERTLAGIAEGAAKGRYPGRAVKVTDDQIRAVMHLGTAAGARQVGLTKPQYIRRRRRIEQEMQDV